MTHPIPNLVLSILPDPLWKAMESIFFPGKNGKNGKKTREDQLGRL
jgi:hypothetical protein